MWNSLFGAGLNKTGRILDELVYSQSKTFWIFLSWLDGDKASKANVNVDAHGKSNDCVFGWFEEHRGRVCVCVYRAVYRAGLFIHCGASHTTNQASLRPSTSSLYVNRSYQWKQWTLPLRFYEWKSTCAKKSRLHSPLLLKRNVPLRPK